MGIELTVMESVDELGKWVQNNENSWLVLKNDQIKQLNVAYNNVTLSNLN